MIIKRKIVISILALLAVLIYAASFVYQNLQMDEVPHIDSTPQRVDSTQQRIERLLDYAMQAEDGLHLTSPADYNAVNYYQDVLLLDPQNTEAIEGLRRVAAIRKEEIEPIWRHEVDRLLDKMELGAIAFNVPTNINIDDFSQVQLILSLTKTVEKLKLSITEKGEKVGAAIKVSRRMEARLSSYMFQITAITPEIQVISSGEQTEWKWEIHPKKAGRHQLHLTLTALLEVDGHSTPRAIRTFQKIIEVNVTTTQKIKFFFNNNWQWLWAAILVPVAGWLWKRKKKQLNR